MKFRYGSEEGFKETFRQRWFPTPSDAVRHARAHGHSEYDMHDMFVLVRRWAKTLAAASALTWAGYQTIGNNIEYSKGERVGVINKLSDKGLFWKTKEGQLALEGIVSGGNNVGANVWDFSLDRQARNGENVDSLNSTLQGYLRDGTKVRITYKQPFATWPWRSSTDYLVQSVHPLAK